MKDQISAGLLQARVAEFVRAHDLETSVACRLLDLVSEIGELSKEVLKSTSYGRSAFGKAANWEAELGDALFSLICLANSTGVDLDAALSVVIAKYELRLRTTNEAGSGR